VLPGLGRLVLVKDVDEDERDVPLEDEDEEDELEELEIVDDEAPGSVEVEDDSWVEED